MDPEEWQPQLQSLCAEAGAAIALVEALPKVRATGAARWLSPTKAVLQLSNRYKWEDIFWFSFFHEAAHILLHRKKQIFIEPARPAEREALDPELRELEADADAFASKTLIPSRFDHYLATMSLSEVDRFARQLNLAPAIVVGRMQHDGFMKMSVGNRLRRRFEFVPD